MVADGHVFVMDFGLARPVESDVKLSATGLMVGTPAYMSPEQARGEKTDAATDVYSFGATLHHLLAGRPPFEASNAFDLLVQGQHDEPPPLRREDRTVDADLETIVLKCLEKEPRRRYATAGALADDLTRWLDGEPIAARPLSGAARLWRRVRRHRAIAAAIVAMVLLAVAGVVQLVRVEQRRRLGEQLGLLSAEILQRKQDLRTGRVPPEKARAALEETVARVDAFVRAHPGHPPGYYVRARGRLYAARYAEALGDVERAIALDPGFGAARRLRGIIRVESAQMMDYAMDETRAERHRAKMRLVKAAPEDLRAAQDEARWGVAGALDDGVLEVLAQAMMLQHRRPEDAAALLERAVEDRQAEEYAVLLGLLKDPAWFDKAVAWAPGYVWARVVRADHRSANRRWAEAIDDLTEAIRVQPAGADLWCSRGLARHGAGDEAGAMRDYDEALRLDPSYRWAYVNRGRSRQSLGDLDGAIREYDEALRLDPGFAKAIGNRGVARKKKGDLDGALRDFDEAIRLDPSNAVSWANRANVKRARGDLDGALADNNEALHLRRDYAHGLVDRALTHRKRGEPVNASRDFEAAIEADPYFAAARVERGEFRMACGDAPAAARDFDEAIRLDPRCAEAYAKRGRLRKAAGDIDNALKDYDEAIRLDPGLAVAYGNRGNAKRATGDLAGALRDLDEAIRLEPGDATKHLNRGLTRSDLKDYAGAVKDFDASLRIEPRNALALASRGRARVALAEYKDAVTDFERALEAAPAGWALREDVTRRLADAKAKAGR